YKLSSIALAMGSGKTIRFSVCTAMFLAITEAAIITTILLGCRNVFGYAYTNDSVVVHYVLE
ncbi:hypothetical protein, partial [Citrobacter youngae]|uniref:hypothetical protein n=1 Tax=Citrobacter youngae TaxID=133448 RepID=UPI00195414BD